MSFIRLKIYILYPLRWKQKGTYLIKPYNTLQETAAQLKKTKMVFCYHNCSNVLWEKIVLVIEKNYLRQIIGI